MQIDHATVTESPGRIHADCTKCGMGVTTGETFGPVPGEVLLVEFLRLHVHGSATLAGVIAHMEVAA